MMPYWFRRLRRKQHFSFVLSVVAVVAMVMIALLFLR